ncbi:MAG: hypothetical protein ABSH44_13100 [Bryobacteraceae bacterium]
MSSTSSIPTEISTNGDTSNERVLISRSDGVPGGIRVDEKGNL